MREYFDASTGAGRCSTDFSWTAATVVDRLRSRPVVQRRVIPPGFR